MRRATACSGLLPPPAEQDQSEEAGGEEWKGSGERGGDGKRVVDLDVSQRSVEYRKISQVLQAPNQT